MKKYRVYANYVYTKVIAEEVEAISEEDAINKAIDGLNHNEHVSLCWDCSGEFIDEGNFDLNTCSVDILDNSDNSDNCNDYNDEEY